MECPLNTDRREILLDFCAGSLDDAEASEFRRHLEQCGECARLTAAQRALWESLDQLAAPEVSPRFDERLYARIAQEDAAPAWRRSMNRILHPAVPVSPWKPALSLVAAAAVLALGVVTYTPHASAPAPLPQVQQANTVHVDIEQVANTLDELDVLMPAPPPKSVL